MFIDAWSMYIAVTVSADSTQKGGINQAAVHAALVAALGELLAMHRTCMSHAHCLEPQCVILWSMLHGLSTGTLTIL